MFKTEKISILKFENISPLHAGSGNALSAVDLPIQRERHTNWPHVQASALKGALRAHFRDFNEEKANFPSARFLCNIIFGSDSQDSWDSNNNEEESLPGAISVSDARLLAFPVRSNFAPFVRITSPAVIERLKKDLEFADYSSDITVPSVENNKALALNWDINNQRCIIEDAVVEIEGPIKIDAINNFINEKHRVLIVSDAMYDYCISSCTEIQAQIKIDADTGTTQDGSLRYQELLPSDSILYALIAFGKQKYAANEFQVQTICEYFEKVFSEGSFVQIGGDETLGRGICKISWIKGGK